jgi:ferric enterobactin receptor
MEFSSTLKLDDFNLSLSVFNKLARNGINTVINKTVAALPIYTATPRPGKKPLVVTDGTRNVFVDYYSFDNNLKSNSQGLDVILAAPEVEALATSFSISGGIFRTRYTTTGVSYGSLTEGISNTTPEYGKLGVYHPRNRTSYFSSGRITSNTHIPKISLVASFTAEFTMMQKTVYAANAGIPIAYYNNALQYNTISDFNTSNPLYGHLYIPTVEFDAGNVPKIYANYHLSISKEIKKRFTFSFNVFNVFNHQPSYATSPGNITFPNPLPTFGAQLSLKL